MNLLIDTCCLLWWAAEPARLPTEVLTALNDEGNEIHLSVASAWEIAIKTRTGKLAIALPPRKFVDDVVTRYELRLLDINLTHGVRAGELELHHRDPFDRMLIAQADIEGLTIATPDPAFTPYGVKVFW